jgi:3-methyladenine DNA glycosylase AlkC
MPEPLKNLFNPTLIATMGEHIAAHDPDFDRAGFVAMAAEGLEALELKARSAQITRALAAHLPADFARACAVLVAALHPESEAELDALAVSDARGLRGWAVMPMADFVAARGLGDFDRSLDVLAEMTKRLSAEFAIRPFIVADPDRALARLMSWTADPNRHVRRLVSEGSRPRLPWGMRLQAFVKDPAPLLPLLVRLRDDPSEYVRRSVANSLNDIAKDHPDLVAALACEWLADAPLERARLVRHACRTLVKQGHPGALAALGFAPADVQLEALEIATPVVAFGGALAFAAVLRAASAQEVVLDYVVHHRKANGGTSPKVFKWKVVRLAPGEGVRLDRRHPMRPITTRTYRDGTHRLEILANGTVLGGADFELSGAG